MQQPRAKREMGGTNFKWGAGNHWPPRWRRPWHRDNHFFLANLPINKLLSRQIYCWNSAVTVSTGKNLRQKQQSRETLLTTAKTS